MLRVLVIEDHAPLARFVTAALTAAGWTVYGPVGDLAAALDALARWPLDLAVIDRTLRGEETFAIVDALAARGIPCLIVSGHSRSTMPERFQGVPFLEKPFTLQELVAAIRAIAKLPGD